jgi:hypothetical protein
MPTLDRCDLYPFCQSQGCWADQHICRRIVDLRNGIDRRPDLKSPRRVNGEGQVATSDLQSGGEANLTRKDQDNGM